MFLCVHSVTNFFRNKTNIIKKNNETVETMEKDDGERGTESPLLWRPTACKRASLAEDNHLELFDLEQVSHTFS